MKQNTKRLLLSLLLVCLMGGLPAAALKKTALVIGNAHYSDDTFDNLPSCINDADAVTAKLKELGFTYVTKVVDGDASAINAAVDKFLNDSKGADVAILYYSGHAIKMGRELCIVPGKSVFRKPYRQNQFVNVNEIRSLLRENAKLSILIFDACRVASSESMPTSTKGVINPKVRTEEDDTPIGSLVLYSTLDDRVASSGEKLSPFTEVLVNHLGDEGEFMSVWFNVIRPLATFPEINQSPEEEGGYTGRFYMTGNKKFAKPEPQTYTASTTTPKEPDKKRITFTCDVPGASLSFYGKEYSFDKPISFETGKSYVYTVEAPGYEKKTGEIKPTSTSSDRININLRAVEEANLIITSNVYSSVTLDGQPVGTSSRTKPLIIHTTAGAHKITLSAEGYLTRKNEKVLKPGDNTAYFELYKDIPEYWDWDGYDGSSSVTYHFSPKYQIGLDFMIRPEQSRFSFGLLAAVSTGIFKGNVTDYSTVVSNGSSSTVEVTVNGETVIHQQTETILDRIDEYSEEIDPEHVAKKYDANAMILANIGVNPCTGLIIEAGFGAAYHQKRIQLPYQTLLVKNETTDMTTGQPVGEPLFEYKREGYSQWFKEKAKWSPAMRLGAKALVPLDGWDKYFLTLGAGYSFIFTNFRQSSWDASLGLLWYF